MRKVGDPQIIYHSRARWTRCPIARGRRRNERELRIMGTLSHESLLSKKEAHIQREISRSWVKKAGLVYASYGKRRFEIAADSVGRKGERQGKRTAALLPKGRRGTASAALANSQVSLISIGKRKPLKKRSVC